MRHIKVKNGSNKYKLKADDGTYIGEAIITYKPKNKTCDINISKRGASITCLSIKRYKK